MVNLGHTVYAQQAQAVAYYILALLFAQRHICFPCVYFCGGAHVQKWSQHSISRWGEIPCGVSGVGLKTQGLWHPHYLNRMWCV